MYMTSTKTPNNTRRTATMKATTADSAKAAGFGTVLIGKSRQGTMHQVYGDEPGYNRANCNQRIVVWADSHDIAEPITAIICERCFSAEIWDIA